MAARRGYVDARTRSRASDRCCGRGSPRGGRGLPGVLALNPSRQLPDARVFEVGHVFSPHRESDGDRPAHEGRWVGLALPGLRQPRAWHAGRERADVFDVKGAVTLVLAAAGISAFDVVAEPAGGLPGYLEPACAAALSVGETEGGWFGEGTSETRGAFGL